MQPRTRRVLLVTHSWTGAVLGSALFVICFSGSWAVVTDELHYWEARGERRPPAHAVQLDAVLASAQRAGLDTRNVTLALPRGTRRHVLVSPGSRERAGQARRVVFDPETGRIVAPSAGRMAEIVTTLHKSLYAGFPGRIAVSLFGAAMTVLVLGGIALHPRRRRDAVTLRIGPGWRGLANGAHRLIGLWLLPLLLLISVTGIFSGLGALGTVTLARFAYPGGAPQALAELTGARAAPPSGEPVEMPSLDALLRRQRDAHPAFRPEALTLSRWGDANATLTVAGTRAGQLSTAVFEKYHYRARDGALQRSGSIAGRGAWLRAFAAIQPLHFAQYGGVPMKLLHFCGGVGASLLVVSGLFLWLDRRRTQSHSTAAVHACALAVCGGLPAASAMLMLVTSLSTDTMSVRPLLQQAAFWGGWLLLGLLCLWRRYRRHGAMVAAAVAGIGFTLASLVDVARSADEPWAAAMPALSVDAITLLAGAGLCILAFHLQRKPAC